MDEPTRRLAEHIKEKGISIKAISVKTGLSYSALYDSLGNSPRDRDLRAGEYLAVCKYLGISADE